jgi:hypothetical protein
MVRMMHLFGAFMFIIEGGTTAVRNLAVLDSTPSFNANRSRP